ncbi:MAG: preprotein translocase subunit SecY [Cytophagales bacterium]|jgi:preprotein translocase subunit SecY|nr:preprotein translocase subunit SecY [Cytophagales bacterium]
MSGKKNFTRFFFIPELRNRILITFFFILIFRIGTFVTLPGINVDKLNTESSGLLGLLDVFLGGAFGYKSIFALGIMPYINASIVIQLLSLAVPKFQKLQREGRGGRAKIRKITKLLTLGIAIFQSFAFISYSVPGDVLLIDKTVFVFLAMFFLTTGTMVCVWIGNRITDDGIGNGISTLIMIGIISSLPGAILDEFYLDQSKNLLYLLLKILFLGVILMFAVWINNAVRKIPLLYAKEFKYTRDIYTYRRQYLPLKLIGVGVMPIIFAQVIMFLISFGVGKFADKATWVMDISTSLNSYTSWGHNISFACLIIIFSYLYTAVNMNPFQIADDLKKADGFIPGIKPGKDTADCVDTILNYLTFWGSLTLAVVAVLPAGAATLGFSQHFSRFFGGTSLLIMVSVGMEMIQQIKSFILFHHYDHIMEFSDFYEEN